MTDSTETKTVTSKSPRHEGAGRTSPPAAEATKPAKLFCHHGGAEAAIVLNCDANGA